MNINKRTASWAVILLLVMGATAKADNFSDEAKAQEQYGADLADIQAEADYALYHTCMILPTQAERTACLGAGSPPHEQTGQPLTRVPRGPTRRLTGEDG
jgi:hypothetical protein